MCKHVAAVMYGIGARLDHQPELLFLLRKVDHLELIEEAVSRAGEKTTTTKKTATGKKKLAEADVAGVFGIELAGPEEAPPVAKPKRGKAKEAPAEPKASTKPKATKSKKGKSGA
jgi:uncharacterized Zn finger protein